MPSFSTELPPLWTSREGLPHVRMIRKDGGEPFKCYGLDAAELRELANFQFDDNPGVFVRAEIVEKEKVIDTLTPPISTFG